MSMIFLGSLFAFFLKSILAGLDAAQDPPSSRSLKTIFLHPRQCALRAPGQLQPNWNDLRFSIDSELVSAEFVEFFEVVTCRTEIFFQYALLNPGISRSQLTACYLNPPRHSSNPSCQIDSLMKPNKHHLPECRCPRVAEYTIRNSMISGRGTSASEQNP